MRPFRPARLVAAGAGVALALLTVFGAAQSASAHDELVQSDPADGATVSTLDAVALTFEEAPLADPDQTADLVAVTGADGRHYETGCATDADTVVSTPVALGAAGRYTVTWRVVSDDGHPVSGTFSFTYAPAGGGSDAAGAETSPCTAVAASGTGGDDSAFAVAAGLSAGAVVIGTLVVAVMLGLQARKRKTASGDASGESGDDQA